MRAEGKMKPEARKTPAVQILLLKHPVGPKGEMKKKTFHSTLYIVRLNKKSAFFYSSSVAVGKW